MLSQKNFVTLFPSYQNFHFNKDVGQLPFSISKIPDFKSKIVFFKDKNADVKNSVLGKIEFDQLDTPKNKIESIWIILKYLFRDSSAIHVLNIYHVSFFSLFYGFIYKILNNKGILYLKTDLDVPSFVSCTPLDISKKNIVYLQFYRVSKLAFHFTIVSVLLRFVDVISVETKQGLIALKKRFPGNSQKLILITNGIDNEMMEMAHEDKCAGKENIILTVGRLGTNQKNTELLLEAFANVDNKDWKLVLIGPIQESFNSYIKTYFNRYPNLKERVVFNGPITDRRELATWYQKAKIFCLSSKWESFGIVLIEALFWGNFLVTTNSSSAPDITDNGEYGSIVKGFEIKDFAECLQLSMKKNDEKSNFSIEGRNHVLNRYNWTKNALELYGCFNEIKKNRVKLSD